MLEAMCALSVLANAAATLQPAISAASPWDAISKKQTALPVSAHQELSNDVQ
jgi:hypothetical protein